MKITKTAQRAVLKDIRTQLKWIEQAIKKCPETMFLRKVSPSFPNEIIEKF